MLNRANKLETCRHIAWIAVGVVLLAAGPGAAQAKASTSTAGDSGGQR